MAGNFVAALWMNEGSLAPCALCCGCGFWQFPVGCGDELGEMVVDVFSSCMVGGCWRCFFLRGCRLVVCELCGWASCPLLMLSALSLAVSAVPRSFPFVAFFFFCTTAQLTDSSEFTTGDDDCDGDGAAPCWSLRSCAAACPCA
ncbi:hypothetical protein TcCL_NonESM08836 [Trypanosoma cruzi]|nr:hypothetical protein TcCL_NonESM08836 [Trypanosoma cruzi]